MRFLYLVYPWAQVRRARDDYLAGRMDSAAYLLATLDLARLGRPRRARALLLRSAVAAARGNPDEAIADLEAAIGHQARPSVVREASVTIHGHLMQGGQYRSALRVVDLGLGAGADDQALLLARCEALAAMGRNAEAGAGYRLILARDPRCVPALLGLALMCAGDARTAGEAVKLCLRALASGPPSVEAEPHHQRLLHTLCRAWLTLGEADACLAFFSELPREAGWTRAYGLGAALAARGETDKAVRELLAAVHDDEDHPFVFQLLRELAGEPLAPAPVWEIYVRLRWRGSHLPRIAAMLPPAVVRGYRVVAPNEEEAVRWIRETLPAAIFESEVEVVSARQAGALTEDHAGILGTLPPPREGEAGQAAS